MTKTLWYALGAFALYEFIAWKMNGKRVAQSLASTGVTPASLPFDLIGQHFGYPAASPAATQSPAQITVNANLAAGLPANFLPGITAMPESFNSPWLGL